MLDLVGISDRCSYAKRNAIVIEKASSWLAKGNDASVIRKTYPCNEALDGYLEIGILAK